MCVCVCVCVCAGVVGRRDQERGVDKSCCLTLQVFWWDFKIHWLNIQILSTQNTPALGLPKRTRYVAANKVPFYSKWERQLMGNGNKLRMTWNQKI